MNSRAAIYLVLFVGCAVPCAGQQSPPATPSQQANIPATGTSDKKATAAKPDFVVFFLGQDLAGDATSAMSFSASSLAADEVPCTEQIKDAAYTLSEVGSLLRCALNDLGLFSTDGNSVSRSAEAGVGARKAAAAAIVKSIIAHRKDQTQTTRAVTHEGDVVLAVSLAKAKVTSVGSTSVRVDAPVAHFEFHEDERQTQLTADLQNLVTVVLGAVQAAGGDIPTGKKSTTDIVWAQHQMHVLTYERANVKVDLSFKASGLVGSDYKADPLDRWAIRQAEYEVQATIDACKDILVGGQATDPLAHEAWSVATCLAKDPEEKIRAAAVEALAKLKDPGARIMLRRVAVDDKSEGVRVAAAKAVSSTADSAAKDDSAAAKTSSLSIITGPKEHVYLSADVLVTKGVNIGTSSAGPLEFTDAPSTFYVSVNWLSGDLQDLKRPPAGRYVVKAFILASKHPTDSYGFGLGVRGKFTTLPAFNFEAFSPFVAVTFTKRTDTATGATSRASQFKAGVSVNLDKAVDWMKKKKA